MKNVITISTEAVLVALIVVYFTAFRNEETKDYQKQFDSLKPEILRIKAEIKAVKADTDTLKADTDTLKVGQRIIFDEVKKNNEKSFWDFFK